MYDDDLIGLELDDVLERFDVDFEVEGLAVASTGEPRDALLDEHVRGSLDLSTPPRASVGERMRDAAFARARAEATVKL